MPDAGRAIRVDVHQHLWPERLWSRLAARREPPCLRCGLDGWMLRLAGEPHAPAVPADHDPERRAAIVAADGLDLALVSLSPALGIERLPPDEAAELLDAYHEGVAALPDAFGAWAAAGLVEPDPRQLEQRLDAGFVGLCLPAGAVASARALDRVGPLLELLERRSLPLLVHPGPVAPGPDAGDMPVWWAALTHYVAEMNAAWHAWLATGRRSHPGLRVCFAMLAGCAPVHAERLRRRAVRRYEPDERLFLDTSSYGRDAVDAVLRTVAPGQLVHGSDRPVIDPAGQERLGPLDPAPMASAAARLLVPGRAVVEAGV